MDKENDMYTITVVYGGYIRRVKDTYQDKYCNGEEKSWVVDMSKFSIIDLVDEIGSFCEWGANYALRLFFVNKHVPVRCRTFVRCRSDSDLMRAARMYKDTKTLKIYTTLQENGVPLVAPKQVRGGGETSLRLYKDVKSGDEDDVSSDLYESSSDEDEVFVPPVVMKERVGRGEEVFASTTSNLSVAPSIPSIEVVAQFDASSKKPPITSKKPPAMSSVCITRTRSRVTIEDDKGEPESFGASYDEEDDSSERGIYERDMENISMKKGAEFEDVNSFKVALNRYAIVNHFDLKFIKSERTRITACCKANNCNWRVHASVLPGGGTFKVKTFQGSHTCSLVKRCGSTRVTRQWVRDRVIPWMMDEGDISAKELKRRLKEKYHIDMTYNKAFRAKGLATSQMRDHLGERAPSGSQGTFVGSAGPRGTPRRGRLRKQTREGPSHLLYPSVPEP